MRSTHAPMTHCARTYDRYATAIERVAIEELCGAHTRIDAVYRGLAAERRLP